MVVKGIFVRLILYWLISVRVKCMISSDAVKCDLFYAREASFSIKLLREMRTIGESTVQMRVKIRWTPFRGQYLLIHNEEIRSSLSQRT